MKLEGRFWITHNGRSLGGRGRIELLSRIAESGSITQAAKAMGMSYKSAWDAVDAMNKVAGSPLVTRSVGGKGGGGTRLTEAGLQLLTAYRRYEMLHRHFLDQLAEDPELASCWQALEQLRLESSARNQLPCRVLRVHREGLQDRVELQLDGGQRLQALVTHGSSERLGLAVGVPVQALVKAPWVHLAVGEEQNNLLQTTLIECRPDEGLTELLLELEGGLQLAALLPGDAPAPTTPGSPCAVRIDPEHIVLCTRL